MYEVNVVVTVVMLLFCISDCQNLSCIKNLSRSCFVGVGRIQFRSWTRCSILFMVVGPKALLFGVPFFWFQVIYHLWLDVLEVMTYHGKDFDLLSVPVCQTVACWGNCLDKEGWMTIRAQGDSSSRLNSWPLFEFYTCVFLAVVREFFGGVPFLLRWKNASIVLFAKWHKHKHCLFDLIWTIPDLVWLDDGKPCPGLRVVRPLYASRQVGSSSKTLL